MFNNIVNDLASMTGSRSRLERDSFEKSLGQEGSQSLIASYKAPNPMVLRPDRPLRIVVPALETFETDGSGEPEVFELPQNVIESPQSRDVLVYAGDSKVSVEVDYDENSFEYADDGEAEDLTVYYVTDADCELEVEKQAPSTHGSVSERIFEEPMALMHQRDQDEQPRYFDVGESELMRVIPKDWRLNVYADAEYLVALEDEESGTRARNAILSMPYVQGNDDLDGLGRAVAHDIVNRA